jgi:hypothetical protein
MTLRSALLAAILVFLSSSAEQIIPGYDRMTAPAIALSRIEHQAIPD